MAIPAGWLSSLDVRCFRNHQRSLLALPDNRPVVLSGSNGSGKTNLLEAVSLLIPGRGLRQSTLADLSPATNSQQPWQVSAGFHASGEERSVRTRRQQMDGSDKRQVWIDDAESTPARLEGLLPQVWLTPKHDRLFSEGSTGRRNFFDRLVYTLYPQHARHRARYDHAWRQREQLLAGGMRADPQWLGVLEQQLAEEGLALAAARQDVTQRLDSACRQREGSFPTVELSLDGVAEQLLQDMPALDAEDRLRQLLAMHRMPGSPAAGRLPHRTDWQAVHGSKQLPARLCSTGEQKAVLLSVVLAQVHLSAAHHRQVPLVLLDEVGAHLDEHKRADLFAELMAIGAQAWLTGTDRVLFQALEGKAAFFHVEAGTVAADG